MQGILVPGNLLHFDVIVEVIIFVFGDFFSEIFAREQKPWRWLWA